MIKPVAMLQLRVLETARCDQGGHAGGALPENAQTFENPGAETLTRGPLGQAGAGGGPPPRDQEVVITCTVHIRSVTWPRCSVRAAA